MDAFARLAAMSALLGTAASLQAQPLSKTIYVDASAPAGGDGTSWNKAYRDFAAACSQATQLAKDFASIGSGIAIDIRLAQGTYRPSPDRATALAGFEIGAKLSTPVSAVALVSGLNLGIFGGYAGRSAANPDQRGFVSVVTADINGDDRPGFLNRGDNAQTVLAIHSRGHRRILVDGLKIAGGNATPRSGASGPIPGGLYIDAGQLTQKFGGLVRHCTFEENRGVQGGGFAGFSPLVNDCQFISNTAVDGGGLYCIWGEVNRCEFLMNTAERGGGAFATGILTACAIVDNVAVLEGGGLLCNSFHESVFSYSRVITCLIAGNSAGNRGGGLSTDATDPIGPNTVILNRCTVVANRSGLGGGICVRQGQFSNGILAGNGATFGGSQAVIQNGYFGIASSLLQGGRADLLLEGASTINLSAVIDADPRFAGSVGSDGDPHTARDNNYRLSSLSPCIDAVKYYDETTLDLDGLPTPEKGPGAIFPNADLGCYEWRQTCPADFDNSGGTPDTGDLAAFFEAFSAGDAAADVNKSGGTPDSDDVEAFFNVWLAGGC